MCRLDFIAPRELEFGLTIRAVASADEAAAGADVLVTATNSVSPTVKPDWLRAGMHLSSINRMELAPPIFAKVERLIVNAREGGKSFTARNAPAIGEEPLCGRKPDAARGTGNERDFLRRRGH